MKKILLVLLALGLAYGAWRYYFQQPKPAAGPLTQCSYVALYGTDTCGICVGYREDLRKMGIPFRDYDLNNPSVRDELYPRMRKAGFNTNSFALPVIDVNGKIIIRPDLTTVEKLYRSPSGRTAPAKAANFCLMGDKFPKVEMPKINIIPQDPLAVSGISMGEKPCAIVGGAVVSAGDKVGQAEVLEIKPDGVTFRDAQGKVFIKNLK
jgi:glutaredoxin